MGGEPEISDEAVEAAAIAAWNAANADGTHWDSVPASFQSLLFDRHRASLEAALPVLERSIRDRLLDEKLIRTAICDPGQFLPRGDDYTESIGSWGARAVIAALSARGAVATPNLPELPPDWYERDGHYEDSGERFTYCDARGPERAHCIRTRRNHSGDHEWAWFTVQDRTRAEAAMATPNPDGER